MSKVAFPAAQADCLLAGLLNWCAAQKAEPPVTPDTLFRRMKPEWLRRFALRDALLPWVREYAGLASFYPDELDACSTPRTLARHLATRSLQGHEPEIRKPVIPFRKDPVCEPTVFVLCCARSGSTLFRCMLMGHPMLYAPPELHLSQFSTMRERERKITDQSTYWMTMGVVQTIAHLRGWNKWQAFHYVSHLTKRDLPVKEVYRLLHALSPKAILVDKTPFVARFPRDFGRLEKDFSDPRYIFLSRHPCGVIDSLMRIQAIPPHPRHTLQEAEEHWLKGNREISDFLQEIPQQRWLHVHHERVLGSPASAMREVAAFLGLDYHPAMLNPYSGDRLMEGIGSPNIFSRTKIEPQALDEDRTNHIALRLDSATKKLACELGYGTVDRPRAGRPCPHRQRETGLKCTARSLENTDDPAEA